MDLPITYLVKLSSGLYMDSNGVLHLTPPTPVPIYNAPFDLPVESEKVVKALKSAKKALADKNDPESIKTFTDLGVPIELFDLLSGVGKVAGIIAPYIAAIAIAYDCLRIFGVIKGSTGTSPLEQMINNRFNEIRATIISLGNLIQQNNLAQAKDKVSGLMDAVKIYNEQLQHLNPTIEELILGRQRLDESYNTRIDGVHILMNPVSYISLFDPAEHTKVWTSSLDTILHVHPSDGSAPVRATVPGPGGHVFDHRLAVPLASFAGEIYLASIRGIVPEHRTTGDYRDIIISMARHIDDMMKNMLNTGLSRTIYQPIHFSSVQLNVWETTANPFIAEEDVKIAATCNRFPVGALDLRYHNDSFFSTFLTEMWNNTYLGQPTLTKHGSFNFRWIPPAKLKKIDRGTSTDPYVYIITNPEECAAAANEVSKQDYAEILLSSGYSSLLQLSALLKNESTEPSVSQTVHGEVYLRHNNGPVTSTFVQNKPIDIAGGTSGVIRSSATRHMRDCSAVADIWTQIIKRSVPMQYSVKLRTLNHIRKGYLGPISNRWYDTPYSDFQVTRYTNDSRNPGFLTLDIFNDLSLQMDERLLMEGSSPRERRQLEGSVDMTAHTFDWWIPVKAPFQSDLDSFRTSARLRSLGWIGPMETTVALDGTQTATPLAFKRSAAAGPRLDAHFPNYFSDEQTWVGEHREMMESTVHLEYKLNWEEDNLTISLKSRSTDRNYIVFVVLEEQMIYSGHVLHTAFPVAVNGQLTYVPQKFFDDEAKAWQRLARAVDDFKDQYSRTVEIGPHDPVVGWLRPGDLNSAEGLEQFITVAKQHQHDLLNNVMNAHGFTQEF